MKTSVKVLFVLMVSLVSGCARLVVLAPEDVERENSREWTIHQKPQAAAPAPATAPAPVGAVSSKSRTPWHPPVLERRTPLFQGRMEFRIEETEYLTLSFD